MGCAGSNLGSSLNRYAFDDFVNSRSGERMESPAQFVLDNVHKWIWQIKSVEASYFDRHNVRNIGTLPDFKSSSEVFLHLGTLLYMAIVGAYLIM